MDIQIKKINLVLHRILLLSRASLLHTFPILLGIPRLSTGITHNIPSDNTAESLTPNIWGQVNKEISLEYHGNFWWQKTGRLLGACMSDAGYKDQRQREILQFFASRIAPFLGQARVAGCQEWESFMTDDHHPIELSWDWHTGKESPTIRFSIEPVDVDAGTLENPSNKFAAEQFHQVLLRAIPELDRQWLEHFSMALAPDSHAGETMEGHPSKVFYAFDLGLEGITAKLYLFPGLVARVTGQTNLEVISKAIRTAPYCGNTEDLPGFSTFCSFVDNPSTPPLELDMLAVDLVHPLSSRLKIYFRSRETSFQSICQTMSLGGLVSDNTLKLGLQRLRKLWDLLLGTKGLPDTCSLPENSHRTAGLLYNVEFRLGGGTPKVKIYIPVRHYARSDGLIFEALKEYMYGEDGQARNGGTTIHPSYGDALDSIFNKSAVQEETGLHTYIACSIQQGGDLRIVSYINGQTDKFQQ